MIRGESLPARIAARLVATRSLSDAERVVLGERVRGEEGRARLVMEALLTHPDPVYRADFLNRLADIPRPDRPPLIDQELGLEPHPPLLSSTATPAALSRVAAALAGQSMVPELLVQADQFQHASDFIEAAGALALAQRVLDTEGSAEPLRSTIRRAWRDLAMRRRCVAQLYDAAQAKGRLLNRIDPGEVPPADLIEHSVAADPSRLPCAVIALQLAGSQPALGSHANWAARVLLSPVLISSQYASLDLINARRAAPNPVVRGEPQAAHRALVEGIGRYLVQQPGEAWRLLPLIGQDPGGTLSRERLDDVVITVLFHAPAVPDAAERVRWAFRRHHAVVSNDPLAYVDYMRQLGPAWADALVLALREPEMDVLVRTAAALANYPAPVVEQALSQPPQLARGAIGGAQERLHRQALRALFRLPLSAETPREERLARRLALDMHRCCRGDRGTCDRLEVAQISSCPVWTPLRWW